ncbi:uncharacterized protein [Amphiura filiformis]|uniref:uncharacterized protein n=1 Tax=Amphiura filiformis TaxID=82378 RepID=UPI003B21FE17
MSSEIRIPAEHEMVVPACLAGNRRGSMMCLVEPIDQGIEDDDLMVARAVVDASSETIPVRIMNLGSEEKVLKAGKVVARLLQIEEEDVEVECEQSVRRCEELGAEVELPEHLTELYERCATDLEPEGKRQIFELLVKYQDIFSRGEYDIGRTKLVQHSIDTQGAQPIRQPLRRSSPEQRTEVERQVAELLDKGLIQPSDSPWASSCEEEGWVKEAVFRL